MRWTGGHADDLGEALAGHLPSDEEAQRTLIPLDWSGVPQRSTEEKRTRNRKEIRKQFDSTTGSSSTQTVAVIVASAQAGNPCGQI